MIHGTGPLEHIPLGWLTTLKHPDFTVNNKVFDGNPLETPSNKISHNYSKFAKDFWILRNNINRQEEELFCFGNSAVHSKGNLIENTLQTSFSCESNIKHAIWCKFKIENNRNFRNEEQKKSGLVDCVCLLDNYFLKVFTEFGENYVSSLQLKVSAVWPTRYGILLEKSASSGELYRSRTIDTARNMSFNEESAASTIYSLTHPLEDICPILFKHGASLSTFGPNIRIIFTSSEPSLAFAFDSKTGLHSIYKIRKCSSDECQFRSLFNTSNTPATSNNSIFSTSIHNATNNLPGLRHSTTKVTFNNLGTSLSSFRSRATSYSTTCSANISLSSQHLSRSHSPMATISRCQSPTNPIYSTTSNALSGHLASQSRSHQTLLASSMGQLECKTCLYGKHNHQSEHLFMEMTKIELCFERIWTESNNLSMNKESDGDCASKVFITTDLIGQSYLCYLVENKHCLYLIRLQKSNDPEQIILGLTSTIAANNVVNLPSLSMMAVMEVNGNIMIFSGLLLIGKLHVPNIIHSALKSYCLTSNLNDKNLMSPYPRRSSLISPSKSSTPDAKFDDGVHLLSPVAVNYSDVNTATSLSFDNSITQLKNSTSNQIIVEYRNLKYIKISLPHLKASPLVHMCLQSLRNILPRDLAMQFLVKWYVARNAPGPQDLTVNQEWSLFLIIFFTLFGYEVNKLNITMINDLDNTSESCSPVVVSKKQKTTNKGSVDDWSYLVASETTKQNHMYLYDAISLSQLNQKNSQDSVIKIDAENSTTNKISMQSASITHLPNVLLSLHLLYEEIKLKSNMSDSLYLLAKLLHQLSIDLNLPSYTQYYFSEFPMLNKQVKEFQMNDMDAKKIMLSKYFPLRVPNIFNSLYELLSSSSDFSYPYQHELNEISKKLLQLFCKFNGRDTNDVLEMDQFFKKITYDNKPNFTVMRKSDRELIEEFIMHAYKAGINKQEIDNFPSGVRFIFGSIINKCREIPPSDWPLTVYNLIERQDLAVLGKNINVSYTYQNPRNENVVTSNLDIAECNDGMDFDYKILQLRFNTDHRIQEIRKLLDSSKPVKISVSQRPDVSDHEFIEEQEKFLLALCTRTMALPIGRGMFTLRTSKPVNTEQLPIPELCLSGKAPPRGSTIELTHIDIPTNMNLWPLFHNGVATGLCIHPNALNVDSTWIVYNKQQQGELGIEHSGFLMALGLNGHLKNLAPFSMYEYLVECHEATSVGLLLGLSATHRGSMDVSMTKLLSLHVETLLPPTSIELNVQQNVQVAALMGVGLVYQGTNHRHIAHALLSEIGRPPGPEMKNCVDRESYSLTAGIALGLVVLNSGGGTDLANIPDVLHYYMVGGNTRPFCGSQKDKYKSPSYQIREGDSINIDVTSPGATIALGLMYLKSSNRAIAEWMTAPNTQYLLDFVRPDLLLLRILARSLILWDEIEPSKTWVSSHVPEIIAKYKLQKPNANIREPIDLETINQAYCNIIAGACMALGLKYAGTENVIAFKTLYHFLKMFMALAHKSIAELAGKATIETCLNVVLLSASIVMAGTGNLEILRACRHLRTRVGPTNSVVTYGSHVAIHMALGFLFIGGGSYTLSNSPSSVAALIISLFPKFPIHSNDNRYHLQALRHFYVLAMEPRLLLPKDIDNGKFCYAKIRLTFQSSLEKEGQKIILKAPCLLPQLDRLSKIELDDDRYWKITFERKRNFEQLKKILNNNSVLHVKQRAGCLSYMEDPHGFRTLLARTLTTEDIIVWTASLKQIISFTTDKTMLNFINRFLKKGDLLNKIRCDDYCTNKMHNDTTLLCLTHPKIVHCEKNDVFSQIYEASLDMSTNENHYLQILVTMTYECVIRDKVNFLPLWIDFTKTLSNINKDAKANFIWQMKFLFLFGLCKDYFKESENVLNSENILANKQQMCLIMDSWENDLYSTLYNTSITEDQKAQIQSYKKFIGYMLHYDVLDQVNLFGFKKRETPMTLKNTSCMEIYGTSRVQTLLKKK